MDTRSRAAATTALLLTASVGGLAASSGAAQASHTHPSDRAGSLTVTIKSTGKGPKLSQNTLRPGNTMFRVVRGNSGGSMEVLRLKPGYTFAEAAGDFAKAFPSGNTPPDVHAVRRIDKNVVFYGGMPVPAKGASATKFGVDIDKAATYYVINLNKNSVSSFQAKGSHQKRSLPDATGFLNMVPGNFWKAPKSDPKKGWMSTTNHAAEPHFVVLPKVKASTTKGDVQNWISTPSGPPPFAVGPEVDANIVSPGHTMIWRYHTSAGKYLALCFWPSKVDGRPHAFMGMWKLFHLT
jgi:hypothetical protein